MAPESSSSPKYNAVIRFSIKWKGSKIKTLCKDADAGNCEQLAKQIRLLKSPTFCYENVEISLFHLSENFCIQENSFCKMPYFVLNDSGILLKLGMK